MASYGQFCPVAKAMEVLDERWTLLVVRELLEGSTHFNELRRGVPRMSPAMLSKRLRTLERAGIVHREAGPSRATYHLTPAGRELADVVDALGAWGVRWIGDIGDDDLDPHLLLWDMRRKVPIEQWPRSRTVLALDFDDVEPAQSSWWIVVAAGVVDVCDSDPGYEPAATVTTALRTLTAIWRGDQSWESALRAEAVRISAPARSGGATSPGSRPSAPRQCASAPRPRSGDGCRHGSVSPAWPTSPVPAEPSVCRGARPAGPAHSTRTWARGIRLRGDPAGASTLSAASCR